MRHYAYYFQLLAAGLLLILTSCNQDRKSYKGADTNVLKGWGEELILPAYKLYAQSVDELVSKAEAFEQDINQGNLEALQKAQVKAYTELQKTLIYDFSYTEKSYLFQLANTYPTKVSHSDNEIKGSKTIQENIDLIQAGTPEKVILKSTAASVQHVYQGFPALDYLLFDEGHSLSYYQGAYGKSTAHYIVMLSKFLKKSIQEVISAWDERLLKAYITDEDASSNGYYAQTINGFIRSYEKLIRADKVGYAAGSIRIQNNVAQPDIIEAYYNGKIDKNLLLIALETSQKFFNGESQEKGKKVKSLYDILVEYKHKDLADKINRQYTLIYKELKAMPLSLKETAIQDNAQMRKLYDLIQKNVAYYKTDMLAAINVSVGYQDTDGD